MGISKITYLAIMVLGILPVSVHSQNMSISVDLSVSAVKAEEELSVTFYIADETDAYFYSVETEFDPSVLEFIDIQNTGLTAGGIGVADFLKENRIGASVSRTEPLTTAASGGLMILRFKVKPKAPAGEHTFIFSNEELVNSSDEQIAIDPLPLTSFQVVESVSIVSLTTSALIEVTEGDTYYATSDVYANGVTQDETNSGRVETWIGISQSDTDPALWDESIWQRMDFTGEMNGYFQYESEIAYRRPLGSYFIAVRSKLDTETDFSYGGVGGNWDSSTHPSAELTVSENPPYRYTIVEWDFDNEEVYPSESLPQNDSAAVSVAGATINGFSSGVTGLSANSNGWDNYDPAFPKYWLATVSTVNFESILLSSAQYGSNTGPQDFMLQVSIDGISWSDVGDTIRVANNWSDAVIRDISLPVLADNRNEVYLRWLQSSGARVDGDSTDISSSGTNRIDDIIVTGINPGAERVEVWPGDTDNDGTVTEADVLPLTAYWGAKGPESIYQTRAWEARGVEEWIPTLATFADAGGDGIVNQNDLLPIGLNFGESRIVAKETADTEVISAISAGTLKAGDTLDLYIHSKKRVEITGVSFRIRVDGVGDSDWQIQSVEAGPWSDKWSDDNRLLHFLRRWNLGVSSAFGYSGVAQPVEAGLLIKVTLRAVHDWLIAPQIVLERASIAAGRDVWKFEELYLSFDPEGEAGEPVSLTPETTELLPNYPNPFNTVTTFRYKLATDTDVKIEIFDAIGRRITTLVDRHQVAGEYNISLDASSLSSGIYFCRFQASGYFQTRPFVFVK